MIVYILMILLSSSAWAQADCHNNICVGDDVFIALKNGNVLPIKVDRFEPTVFITSMWILDDKIDFATDYVLIDQKTYPVEYVSDSTCNDISVNEQTRFLNTAKTESFNKCQKASENCYLVAGKSGMTHTPLGKCIFYADYLGFTEVKF